MTRANLLKRQQIVLSQLRADKGWTQEEVYKASKINGSIYSRLERGVIMLNLLYVFALAKAYNMQASDIMAMLQGTDSEGTRRRNIFIKKIEDLLEENEYLKKELQTAYNDKPQH